MRVGLILEQFDPSRGGLEHWTFQFAQKLIAQGHEVHAVTFHAAVAVRELGVQVHTAVETNSRLKNGEVLDAKAAQFDFDIRHDMGVGWASNIIHPHGGCLAAHFEHNLLRIPRWRRITFFRERRYREAEEAERRQHANPNATIVCVSEMVQRHFLKHSALTADRLPVIFNGVDTLRFSPEQCAPLRAETRAKHNAGDNVIFLLVAHNLQLKNAAACIQAIRRVKGARLWIVGSRKTRRAERLARKLNAPVDFVGQVPDALPYYAGADVCLHPTWYDPCSLVTLEAAACGLPVITTHYNGMSDMMRSGREGFIVDPSDIDLLSQAMEETMEKTRRQALGSAARSLAEHRTFDRQVSEFLRLYEGCARAMS